ncbi:MAG: histidine--tRNA ligase [Calditrichaeota bacterium]|nr:histidine--tRNA ligase [Calditrichota bacterium]
MSERITARIYNGTRDFLPAEMLRREALLETLRSAFQLYGFAPVETPAMEYLEILLGKYGDDEKLIYKLDYRNDDPSRRLALRYDHTVPLARLVACNPELPLPFKRYQFQPVWRADRPQPRQGRFREFWQCDIDTIGSASLMADAEIIAAADGLLAGLQLPDYRIRLNHRGLLAALVAWAGLPAGQEAAVCGAIDKLDKVGLDGVRRELDTAVGAGSAVDKLLERLAVPVSMATLPELRSLDTGDGRASRAVDELLELNELLGSLGVNRANVAFDLYLARGLSYYTGPIFETVIPSLPHMGSIMGGGRYDSLIGLYLGREMPATGLTMGLDRILAALAQLGETQSRQTPARVLVTRSFAETDTAAIELAGELRRAGIPTELALEAGRLKKQFALADRKGIPHVITLGPDEQARGLLTLKTLADGTQRALSLADAIRELGGSPR